MILSRAKPAIQVPKEGDNGPAGSASSKKQLPKLEDFLTKRDYMGALSLLEFQRNSGQGNEQTDLWIGYCAFHVGDYKRALMEYEALLNSKASSGSINKIVSICLACTYFYLGMYQEAEKAAEKADKGQLKTRLRFHLAHKFGDEKKLMTFHQELEDIIEDQLSLASIHYLRSHYQEAIGKMIQCLNITGKVIFFFFFRYLQANPFGQPRVLGSECLCSLMLLQIGLL